MKKIINIISIFFIMLVCLTSCESKFIPTEVTTEIDSLNNKYKHINNGGIESNDGLPYDIDAITGATVTIEGPAVVTSIPLSVREIENNSKGIVRGTYKDSQGIFNYEGLDVYYLLNEMKEGDSGIILTNTAYKVVFKNSNREEIASLKLSEVENAHTQGRPIILAYGIGSKDEKVVAPFVYDGASESAHSLGYSDKLKNDDGCIKLVYDNETYGDGNYKKFVNAAYVYLCEEKTPGFKHTNQDKNGYGSSKYVDNIITFRGKALGREYDFTTKKLEDLVSYDSEGKIVSGGIGYSDWYSLANNAYWYVNEYEGLKLYELLQYLGMKNAEEMGEEIAERTFINFVASDGVPSNESFAVDVLASPETFGFYKKNAQDNGDGEYTPTNADLVKLGYPVLLSYGVNNYPYTISKTDKEYVSGLSNAGGPFRVVFGKRGYNHPNGSNQVQLLSEVIAGKNVLYNTHIGTDNKDLNKLADEKINFTVVDDKDKNLISKEFAIGEIEKLVYGEKLDKENKNAKVKESYFVDGETDVYEGINLKHLLLDIIAIPGMNGNVIIKGDTEIKVPIDDIFAKGYNTELNRENLTSILAYAKNGSPLVNNKSDLGYEEKAELHPFLDTESTEYKIDNQGGPIKFIKPSSSVSVDDTVFVNNVKEIKIELMPDSYAHLSDDSIKYGENKIKFFGPGLEKEKEFTVSDIEGMQILAKTSDFSILGENGELVEKRYRGIGIYDLFKIVGIKNNAGDVTVTCDDGNSFTYNLMRLKKTYPNFIDSEKEEVCATLAYGIGNVADDKMNGKPLTEEDGGPLLLIVPQEEKDNPNENICLKNVKEIYVNANEVKTWRHNISDVFSEFLDYKFDLVFKNDKYEVNKTFTLAELEKLTDLVVRDNYTVLDIGECEGLDLWKLIKMTAGDTIDISNPVAITAYAEDGYKNDLLSKCYLSGFTDGIDNGNGALKIMLCYAIKGYPLVDKEKHEGYTGIAKNCDGPLRVVVENFQGGSIKYCNKVVVTLPGSDELNIK